MRLILVGDCKTYHTADKHKRELYSFYGDVFAGASGIDCLRTPARHIGYECAVSETENLVFIGFEAERCGVIPRHFKTLALSDHEITIRGRDMAGEEYSRTAPVRWNWRDFMPVHAQRWVVGEFSFDLSIVPNHELSGAARMWPNFNIFGRGEIEGGDRIEIVDYRESWPAEFTGFSSWLKSHFPAGLLTRIEHIGSTAVSGMPAKPVIDILAEIPSFSEARRGILPLMDESWEYCWYNDHILLIKREKFRGKRTRHLHLAPPGHEQWKTIVFRDALRNNPKIAEQYASLKRRLAREHAHDREQYTEAKSAFIASALDGNAEKLL